jgi:hypothetical protein
VETPHHPEAVGTYGPALVEWVRREQGQELRWFQRYAVARILEHDRDGALCWAEAGMSTARQSGKSVTLRSLAGWRLHQADLLGEPQTILHVSNNLGVVNEVAMPALIWASERGYYTRKTNGEVEIRLADGSRWVPRSSRSAYGLSAGLALVDECWDLAPLVVDSMILPTLLERRHPQLVLFSTAHPLATSLFPGFRLAGGAQDSRLVLEWSADPADDPGDVETWRQASPHWSEQRERALARAWSRVGSGGVALEDFTTQYLNIWPGQVRDAKIPPPFPTWAAAPQVLAADPPAGCLVAIDEEYDGSACAIVGWHEGRAWYRAFDRLEDAVPAALAWEPSQVLVGLSMRDAAMRLGVNHPTAYGMRETSIGTPLLMEAVRRGDIAHEHAPALDDQAAGAKVSTSDAGVVRLSVKGSRGSVLGMKLLAWCLVWERGQGRAVAAIW